MSIFLPNCILGATSAEGAKTFKWHVEGKKKNSGGHNTGSLNKMKNTLRIGKKDIAFSFKARTHAEMIDWWTLMQHPAKASCKLPSNLFFLHALLLDCVQACNGH